jgi:small conductance mechanosensitive channel
VVVDARMTGLTIRSELESAFDQAVDQLVSIGVGILSVVIVIALARLLIRIARRFFWKRIGSTAIAPDAATLVNNGISVLVYFAAVTLLLALWGASWATLLTAISISTLAVVLGLQDLLKSLLGGAFVILDQPYSVGDRIEIDAVEGEVAEVGLRTTIVRSNNGHHISIPNAVILTVPLQNYDRAVASETVVSMTSVHGEKNTIQLQIDSALSADPPIAAAVTISADTPVGVRDLVRKFGIPVRPSAAHSLDADLLRISLVLPGGANSRAAEQESIKRMGILFPDAQVTVRRGARRS